MRERLNKTWWLVIILVVLWEWRVFGVAASTKHGMSTISMMITTRPSRAETKEPETPPRPGEADSGGGETGRD